MASSSSNQPCPNEVFISFRGEDTRNNFVSHLHSALKERGIRTYFDANNLQKGQTISIQLAKAIQESRIAIVVLSSNYGWSTWCLNELVKIMECNKKSHLVVLPIFYHIEARDVRKQENSFFQAFSSHEVNFKDDGDMVKSWREALTQLANLAGDEIRGQNEASYIKEIAGKILRLLPVKASKFRKSVVGIKSRISELKELMYSKPNEVLFIGLWGMGGIGKTTTARVIFEDCKHEFEGSCFLQDVKESKNKMENLQKYLLSDVLKTEFEGIRDVVTGSSMIQERLQFKKVLLVIDDVDNVEQLNVLADQCDWFGGGSRIIITTRDEHIINEDHIVKYDVQTLPENEALHLFSLYAFKDDHPPENYKELSYQVLRYVSGLPLALRVLGRHLYRRDTCVWESTLNRLKDIPDDEIISRLHISFNELSVLQQNIFLDIACFFRGYSRDEVEERLESLELHPKEGIQVLSEKSLIHVTMNGQQIYHIEMHDLLQEMGWYIVRKRSNWDVRRCSRLWLKKDILEVFSDITVSSEAERICLRTDKLLDNDVMKTNLGWKAISRNMNKLNFLHLCGDFFEEYEDTNDCQPFGNTLRWFFWIGYPGHFLPKSFHPTSLVHLHMECSQIKETPDFSHMPNLEVLNLFFSIMLVYVHPSLGNHKKIKRIILARCAMLEAFPKISHMKSLEILDLSSTNLQKFPEIYGNVDSLRILNLRSTYVDGLPTSIVGNTVVLQELMLRCWPHKEEFTSLQVVATSFPRLVNLEITDSGIMWTMDFSRLPYLQKLDLSRSEELLEVHSSLGVHKRIKSINLTNCSKLEKFPRIVSMDSLEELYLSYTRLQSFPEMTGNVNHLVRLKLDGTEITTVPWSIGRATSLKILSMIHCEFLLTLPINFLGPQLQRVHISSGSLKYFEETIVDETPFRQSKRQKQLIGAEGEGQLSGLQMYFRYCKSLEEIPEFLLSRIEVLVIRDCTILTGWICFNLVDLLDKYQHLCHLELHQKSDIVPQEIVHAFSEWEEMPNMLRKREECYTVSVQGRKIASWFQYQFRRNSVTVFLPLSFEHKLKGFVISGLNVDLKNKYDHLDDDYDYWCCPGSLHVVVTYVPVNNIRRDIRGWDGQNEFTLLELNSRRYFCTDMVDTSFRWGLSLVYNDDEVSKVDPCQLVIVTDDIPDSSRATFRVKLAGSTNMTALSES